MALLFPRVIKSCTFKMTSDPCSLKQKKKKKEKALREAHKKGAVVRLITSEQKCSKCRSSGFLRYEHQRKSLGHK